LIKNINQFFLLAFKKIVDVDFDTIVPLIWILERPFADGARVDVLHGLDFSLLNVEGAIPRQDAIISFTTILSIMYFSNCPNIGHVSGC
jgi:hypothetical protein